MSGETSTCALSTEIAKSQFAHGVISTKAEKSLPKEKGMAELMWKMYDTFNETLTHEMLYTWHKVLMQHERGITDIGKY
ncbi:MAG: hypothetical protein WB791_10075 [Waddliaceae bacterium]